MNASPTASGALERQQVARPPGRRCRRGGRTRGPSRRSRSARARWRGTASAAASRPGRRSRPGRTTATGSAAPPVEARAPASPPRPSSPGRRRPARTARVSSAGGLVDVRRARPRSRCARSGARPARAAASSRRSVPAHVDVAVVRVGMAGGAVHGGHVHDRLRALDQARERVARREVALHPARRTGRRRARASRRAPAPRPRRPAPAGARAGARPCSRWRR